MKAFWLEEGNAISTDELNEQGIPYQQINVDDYRGALEQWKQKRGYASHDEVKLSPQTPELDKILSQFDEEHLHTDDEVRYVVSGTGIFDIRSRDDRWMRIEVTAGDFIIVPANVYHRFFLTEEKNIHAVRLFKENPSWVPVYRKKIFVPSITKEEINELPLQRYEGPICLVRSDKELEAVMPSLRDEMILGFDTETRPSFKKGVRHPLALVQLATSETVYIFQMRFLTFPNLLQHIFENKEQIKAGVALRDDVKELKALMEFEATNFIDLSDMATERGVASNGLRALTAYLLRFRISKRAKVSNWAKEQLSDSQIAYAATDAWVSREIYLKLKEMSPSGGE